MRLYRRVTHHLQWLVQKRLTPRLLGEFFTSHQCSSILWAATESACKYSVRIHLFETLSQFGNQTDGGDLGSSAMVRKLLLCVQLEG